jgi:hypothetical protein
MKKTITLVNTSGETEKIELTNTTLNFYKQETKRIRLTERGLTKFFSNLFKKFSSN